MRLIVLNPNTNSAVTKAMVAIAREEVGHAARVEGLTAPHGASLIADPAALAVSADAVAALAPALSGADGVVIAAFGDPGLLALRAALQCPVTGIAEAGMAEAAADNRRFAVVTTTPALTGAIARTAARYGHGGFCGTWLTPGDPIRLHADPESLATELAAACRRAVAEGGAEAVCIGGGPLAAAARRIAGTLPVPVIEPLPAAIRLTRARLAGDAP